MSQIPPDEPLFQSLSEAPSPGMVKARSLPELIRSLVRGQQFALLCTQAQSQPYGSLVACAFDQRLGSAVFATPATTRKYRLLSLNDRVALVVDNRGQFPNDMMRIEAVTATGRASEVKAGPAWEDWASLLIQRHPHLRSFVHSPSSKLFRVEITRYFHVVRFQEVRQWVPPQSG